MAFEQLRDRIRETPISSIIELYIPITKKGPRLVALCPFHADTKPSMNITDSKGMFKCFACGAGGDAIGFVMDYTKVTFVEALKDIAGKLGIPFEEYQKEKKKNPKVEMAFRVLNASSKLYLKVASAQPEPFKAFVEKRKLTPESIEKYQIGYAPGNNALLHYLERIPEQERAFAQDVALEMGIVKYNEARDSYYDFYRDRVMFPIHDHSGQIRGYSSRAVLPDQVPKYLNSGESFAFEKSAILFGYYFAKSSIRQLDQVIVVEGNMDVIMMHQYGFTQTVGTMGIALSDQSIRLLSNMTKNVYLGMDSDAAGKKAMQKINADFLAMGILPKFVNFEPAKDPDEFLLAEGRLALQERLEKAPVLLDVMIQENIPASPYENIDMKLKALRRVFELVAPLKEHLGATERVVEAAKMLKMNSDSATILEDYKVFLSKIREKAPVLNEKSRTELKEVEIEEQKLQREQNGPAPVQESGPISKSEKVFLREIVCHPEFLTQPNRDEFLAYIGHPEVKRLFQWLVKIYFEIDEAEYVPMVQDELLAGGYSKEIRDIVTEALFHTGNTYNEKVIQRMLKDYLRNLKLDQLKNKRNELVERQKISESQEEIDQLLSEIHSLSVEISNIKNMVP